MRAPLLLLVLFSGAVSASCPPGPDIEECRRAAKFGATPRPSAPETVFRRRERLPATLPAWLVRMADAREAHPLMQLPENAVYLVPRENVDSKPSSRD